MIRKDDIIEENIACVPSVEEEKPIPISEDVAQTERELEQIAPDGEKAIKTKNTSKNFAFTLLFIAVNVLAVVLTALIEFKGDEQPIPFGEAWRVYIKNYWWVLGSLLMFVLFNVFQALKRRMFLQTTLKKDLPLISLNATLLCKYYDNITPLGSGGQPFEIYYLRKKGIPLGVASGVPLVSYALDRIAYVFITFFVLIFYGFGKISTFLKVLCIIGLVVNAAIPFALLFFSVLPKTAERIAGFIAKIAKLLHIAKDAEAFKHSLTESLKEYVDCIRYFVKKSKTKMLLGILLSVLWQIALYSIPFFVIKMSGAQNVNYGEILALTVICYTSVTLLPTPGNSGGAELSFRSIFERFLTGGTLFWGVMSWRVFSYYLSIFTGIILIIAQSIYRFSKRGKAEREKGYKSFESSVIRSSKTQTSSAVVGESSGIPNEGVSTVAESSVGEGGSVENKPTESSAESVEIPSEAATGETLAEGIADNEPQGEEIAPESGHYTPVITPAAAITIHEAIEEEVVSTETILPDKDTLAGHDMVVTAEAVESVFQVKAVISYGEGLQVTEISGDEPDGSAEQNTADEADGSTKPDEE